MTKWRFTSNRATKLPNVTLLQELLVILPIKCIRKHKIQDARLNFVSFRTNQSVEFSYCIRSCG